jgi:hypothetical protein
VKIWVLSVYHLFNGKEKESSMSNETSKVSLFISIVFLYAILYVAYAAVIYGFWNHGLVGAMDGVHPIDFGTAFWLSMPLVAFRQVNLPKKGSA